MRLRAAAAPLALVLALLTACSAESSLEDFEALRAALDAAEGVHIAARVAAAGERPEEYRLTLEGTAADCTVTVVEPEALAGVSAHITENGAEIGYGPLLLAAGDLDGAGLSAITALPRLLAATTVKTLGPSPSPGRRGRGAPSAWCRRTARAWSCAWGRTAGR